MVQQYMTYRSQLHDIINIRSNQRKNQKKNSVFQKTIVNDNAVKKNHQTQIREKFTQTISSSDSISHQTELNLTIRTRLMHFSQIERFSQNAQGVDIPSRPMANALLINEHVTS